MNQALGMIFGLLGVTLFLSAFVIASNPGEATEEKSAGKRGTMVLFVDFLLALLDSIPVLSLIWTLWELPETARMMKERCRAVPLTRGLLVAGSILFLAAGICFWGPAW